MSTVHRFAESWQMLVLRGLAAIAFGILALVIPGITVFALVLLFAAYALADGAFVLTAAIRNPRRAGRGAMIVQGVLGILVALVTVLWPGITAIALLVLIAAWAILTGLTEIFAAVTLRKETGREWLLALAGALSVLFGILVLLKPAAGALAVVAVIAAYAFVYGTVVVWLGLNARRTAQSGTPEPSPAG
jgi:uncharacterized membrane protein HdeD (DUF308 family)